MKNTCDVDDCDDEAVVGLHERLLCMAHFDEGLRAAATVARVAGDTATGSSEESHV